MRRRENPLYLVSKIAQRLEHSWAPLNGGLTIMTLVLDGATFVDGVYVPPVEELSAVRGEEGEEARNAANPDARGSPGVYGRRPVGVRQVGG